MISLIVCKIIVSQDWGELPGIEFASNNLLILKEPDTQEALQVKNPVFLTLT